MQARQPTEQDIILITISMQTDFNAKDLIIYSPRNRQNTTDTERTVITATDIIIRIITTDTGSRPFLKSQLHSVPFLKFCNEKKSF